MNRIVRICFTINIYNRRHVRLEIQFNKVYFISYSMWMDQV